MELPTSLLLSQETFSPFSCKQARYVEQSYLHVRQDFLQEQFLELISFSQTKKEQSELLHRKRSQVQEALGLVAATLQTYSAQSGLQKAIAYLLSDHTCYGPESNSDLPQPQHASLVQLTRNLRQTLPFFN